MKKLQKQQLSAILMALQGSVQRITMCFRNGAGWQVFFEGSEHHVPFTGNEVPPKWSISKVQFRDVANTGTLDEIIYSNINARVASYCF